MTSLLTLTSYWLQSLTLFFGHPALSSGHPAYLSYAAGPSALDVHFVSTPRIVAGDHVTILGQHAGSIVSVTRSGATYVARLQLNPLLSSTVTSGTVALVTETASPLIENSTEKDGVEQSYHIKPKLRLRMNRQSLDSINTLSIGCMLSRVVWCRLATTNKCTVLSLPSL